MSFAAGAVIVFLLANVGLLALELGRKPLGEASDTQRYGWLALLAGVAHPLAWWIAEISHLTGDLTPFLAFDLLAAGAIAAAAANRAPGGKAFLPLLLAAVLALALGVQWLSWHPAGISASLMAAVLLCTVLIGAAAECARHARLDRAARRPVSQLALLCIAAAGVQLLVALLQASGQAGHGVSLGADAAYVWLALKLMLTGALLSLFAARRSAMMDRLSRRLVEHANAATQDLRVVTQAFYQMQGKALVTDSAGRILFVTAEARRLLAYPDTTGRTLENLFIAVQPTGHQQVRALFERPDHQVELLQIRMTGVECGGQTYHLMQLEPLAFDYAILRSLLVDSRDDAPHEASGLLDHHFAVTAMADGWFRLLDPVDRYAGSGLFWDKLRMLSGSDSEISHLENGISTGNEAHGWLQMRNGEGLSVSLRKLQAPDHKLFYRVEMQLVDEALHERAAAPCAGQSEGQA
jgi:PAS domain-containing protein